MEIVLIVMGSLTIISLAGMVLDYVTKKNATRPSADTQAVFALTTRVAALEAKLAEQETRTFQLEESARFTAKLLENKSH